ncbi:MAG: hypothetical protein H5U26_11375 [Immundisolibacter sp.]|uniref:phage tail protein n=1 Tax=Immundisolibacter sp. TaxID=1934948 RepID=UPI0019860688|nr:phage tail protein [Immundisolibacter sp.]MBC7162689.1 hypothetical protein [Immundisolibacter sp.]
MGGSSKKQTVGYWYKLLYHAGLCKGPIDAFLEFRGGDRTAWQGNLTASGTININKPKLWGGTEEQGGIVSDVDVMFGEATQAPNAYLLANLGAQVPAWRGLATLVFKGGKYGAMNPYPQKASYKIRKIRQGWDTDPCWYPETAPVGKIMQRAPVSNPYGWLAYSTGWLNIGCAEEWTGTYFVNQSWFKGSIDSIRVTKGVARYTTETYAVPTDEFDTSGADPYWANVLFCLLFNGDNGSTTIIDAKGHTVTAYGGAALSTAQSKFGGSSCYFDGIDDRVQIDFTPGEEDLGQTFTLEAWINLDTLSTYMYGNVILSAGPLSIPHRDTDWRVLGDKLSFFINDSGPPVIVDISGDREPIGVGEWHFVSLSRNGATGLYYMHVDGVLATGLPDIDFSMNPAHILYFARTNSDLGREPTANINDASLAAAADTLYAEGFGICTTRDPANESVEEFEQRISKLIDGAFSRDPITGQWHLDLARGDYVLGDLPILTDDDILDFKELPSTLDNAVNSVSVKYFDPEKKETITTPPVQARALIAAFGTIHQTIDYPEIPTASLAARVAQRELQATATPTRALDLVCTRKPFAWRPNTYFRLQAPKRGIADMVCIVGEKETGSLKSGAIRLKATQDIYSLPATAFAQVEPGVDTDPSQTPAPITAQAAFEAPYIEVVSALSRADLEVLPADVGYLATVAADPAVSTNYTAMVDAGAGYIETVDGDWCPSALVVEVASWPDTAFTLSGATRLDEVAVGSAALWDDEIVRVDAIDPAAGTVTLARGCADTVPSQHAAGSRIWFYQDNAAVDLTEYTAGETLAIKLLTNTSSQQLDIGAASAMSLDVVGRAVLPYPPGNVKINGVSYPVALAGNPLIAFGWAHRDRLLQADQLIDTLQASIGPEAATTYTLRLYGETDTLLRTETGLTGSSYTWTDEEADSGLTVPGSPGFTYNEDTFDTDSTSQYTQVADANATWAIASGELTATGGTQAKFIRNGTSYTDVVIEADINTAGDGGLVLRFVNSSNYYLLALYDDSGAAPSQNIRIFKRVGGAYTQLAQANISWARGTSKTIRFRAAGTALTAFVDGQQVASATDSAHAGPGGVGLRNNAGGGNVSKFQAFRWNIQGTQATRLNGRIRAELESVRAGLVSHQKHNITVDRAGWGYQWGNYWGGP